MDFKDRVMQRADDLADAKHNCGFYDMACGVARAKLWEEAEASVIDDMACEADRLRKDRKESRNEEGRGN